MDNITFGEISVDPIEYFSNVSSVSKAQLAMSSSDGVAESPDVTAVMVTLTKYIEVLERVSEVLEQYKELVGKTTTALDAIGRSFYLKDMGLSHAFTLTTLTAKNE